MKFLVLGDIFPTAINELKKKLPNIIKKNKIDFVIANGENAARDANGITKKAAIELFNSGIDVLTSGNHIWDKKEIMEYIKFEKRLLRPANMHKDLPGQGINIFKKNGFKICVINLMTNIFMLKSENVFKKTKSIIKNIKLKKDVDFIIVDIHGEFAGEKIALGHMLDGKSTLVFGSHTHVPTSDARILSKGTGYQTDLGMCGDYNSVIGLNKKIFLDNFLKIKNKEKNIPASGKVSICGSIIEASKKTGLTISINQLLVGGKIGQNKFVKVFI